MLKLNIENKAESREMRIEILGRPRSRAEVEEAKRDLLAKVGGERDESRLRDLTTMLASINSALDAFDKMEAADREIESNRSRFARDEAEIAGAAQRRFDSNCRSIALRAMPRFTKFAPPFASYDDECAYRTACGRYYDLLFVRLSYDKAEEQAREMERAAGESREWRDLVKLPKPTYFGNDPNKVEILKKGEEIRPYVFRDNRQVTRQAFGG